MSMKSRLEKLSCSGDIEARKELHKMRIRLGEIFDYVGLNSYWALNTNTGFLHYERGVGIYQGSNRDILNGDGFSTRKSVVDHYGGGAGCGYSKGFGNLRGDSISTFYSVCMICRCHGLS